MRKLNQSGMTGLGILLVVLLVGGAGFVGWRVYDANNKPKTEEAKTTTNQNEQKSEKAELTVPDGYVAYQVEGAGFQFAYPKGWLMKDTVPAASDSISSRFVDVSKRISHEEARSSKQNIETYKNDLILTANVTKASYAESSIEASNHKIGENDQNDSVLGSVTLGSKTYKIIGGKFNGEITQIVLMDCTSEMICTHYLKLANGDYLDIGVSSIVNIQSADVPIDTNSAEYQEFIKILGTFVF